MIISRRAVLIAPLLLATAPSAARAEPAKLTFVLTNDIYLMGETVSADGKPRGGFARLAAIVKAERAKGGHVIFAHGGDTLSPSLMSGIDRGAHIVSLTNMIPPDIFVPGNHEFDFGKATFLQRMSEARFPLYAANLRMPDGQPVAGFKDREIVTVGGVRIGLTGATYDDSPRASSPQDLVFRPTVRTMRTQAEALRRDGADFVVAVMHADRKQAIELAGTQAADLILTGHNHDLFIQFDGHNAIVESGHDAEYVTMIDVTIDVQERDGRRQMIWWPQFRIVDTATVTPDPEVAAAVAGFERELNRAMDVPIATLAVELDSRNANVRAREAAIGNLIADAMRAQADADVAITNGGGIRAGRVYAAGSSLTRRDVMAELPFGNRLVVINISGSALRAAIENGLSRLPNAAGRFPQVSGLTVQFDPSRPPGQRVLSIMAGDAMLDPRRLYRVATNDFLARGSDGYTMFGEVTPILPEDDSPLLATEVMTYVQSLGTVRSRVEGRLVPRSN